MKTPRHVLTALASLSLIGAARAQGNGIPVFSVDWNSPTIGLTDSIGGFPISEGDLLCAKGLYPAIGPLPTPGIIESAGFLAPFGLNLTNYLSCFGHPAYTPCLVEVDALSHGLDAMVDCSGTTPALLFHQWAFSVNHRGIGQFGSPAAPAVWTEAPCQDEAADVFVDLGLPCGPLPPTSPNFGNTGYIDGNGMANCTGASLYPGVGLIENAPPLIYGDNLDALDDDVPDFYLPQSTCTYFSLDSAFVDPYTGLFNTGSAAGEGYVGGDVLMTCPGCGPGLYASATQLGLDAAGPDTDDLDALALRENGILGYQRSATPYDWTTGSSDMLFFSVRRGSAIVGTPDSIFGLPIEPGDILVPNGPLGTPPGIFIAAENLGLFTSRFIVPPPPQVDDLDALDVLQEPNPGQGFCFNQPGWLCPCGNSGAPGRGCGNSQNSLGALLWGNGIPSISNDHLKLTMSGAPYFASALLIQGTTPLFGVPLGDGNRCVGGSLTRLLARSALCGNREFGFGVPGDPSLSAIGGITSPVTMHYQVRYRDINPTFCSVPDLFNWTNGYSVAWGP